MVNERCANLPSARSTRCFVHVSCTCRTRIEKDILLMDEAISGLAFPVAVALLVTSALLFSLALYFLVFSVFPLLSLLFFVSVVYISCFSFTSSSTSHVLTVFKEESSIFIFTLLTSTYFSTCSAAFHCLHSIP